MRWPRVALGEHIDVLSGFAFKSKQFNSDGHGLPLIRIRDVLPGRSSTFYDGPFDERFVVSDSEILIGMDGEFNCARWAGGKSLLNQRVCKVTSKSSSLDDGYLFRVLPDVLRTIEDQTPFVTVKHLSAKALKEAEIPLPPLEEQKRIAAILDQADSLRRLRQRAIDRLNSLGQAIFFEMFGDPKTNSKKWETVKLGDVAEFYSGNSLPEGKEFAGEQGGYFLLKVSDLNFPENSREIEKSATWSQKPGSRAGTCPANSIVFPKRGGAIGTNKKRLLRRGAILDPNLMGVCPRRDLLNPEFLFGWFFTFNLSDIASGSSVPQLNKQDLSPLELFLPPIELQRQFADRVAALVKATNSEDRYFLNADRLFSSLQHRAFRGEL